jgi:hypothetical protein
MTELPDDQAPLCDGRHDEQLDVHGCIIRRRVYQVNG